MARSLDDLRAILNTYMDDDTNNFIDATERTTFLNSAYFDLYNWAESVLDGNGPVVTKTALTVVSGTETIALPPDFYRLVALYYRESDTCRYKWSNISASEQHVAALMSGSSKQLAFYRRGSNVVAVPTPTWSDSTKLILEYVPNPTAMSDDTDEPTGIPDSHRELIAMKAFMKLKEKEGVDPSASFMVQYKEAMRAFERDMESWQANGPMKVAGPYDFEIYGGYF